MNLSELHKEALSETIMFNVYCVQEAGFKHTKNMTCAKYAALSPKYLAASPCRCGFAAVAPALDNARAALGET